MGNEKLAKEVYKTICNKLDNMGWKYEKIDDDLVIKSGVKGDDLPIEFIIVVNADTQLVRYMSKLPFSISEDKRVEAAIAVCAANNGMVDGNFDYDFLTGDIIYRMTVNFRDSLLGAEVFEYMVIVSSKIVDKYNDRFLMISKDMLSIEQFLAAETEQGQ